MTVKINEKFVKMILIQRNEDIRQVAERSGIGEATLYRIIRGAGFTSHTLGKLAAALECSPNDLIVSEGFPSPLVVAQTVLPANAVA